MTELQLKTDLANITDAELIEQAKNMICKLAETSGRSLQMSVPPNKRDTDMLLMELVNRYDNVVNNLLISGVVVPKGTLCECNWPLVRTGTKEKAEYCGNCGKDI